MEKMNSTEISQLIIDLRQGDATAQKAADLIEQLTKQATPGPRTIPVLGTIEDEVVYIKPLELPPGTKWGE